MSLFIYFFIFLSLDVEFPHYWTPQPTDSSGREETVHLVQLDSVANAQEYKKVSDHFHRTCPNNICKIERVQNPALYGAYIVCKQKMDKAGGRGSNEMYLFHGTKGDKCELINHKGFNRSFCGENGKYNRYLDCFFSSFSLLISRILLYVRIRIILFKLGIYLKETVNIILYSIEKGSKRNPKPQELPFV